MMSRLNSHLAPSSSLNAYTDQWTTTVTEVMNLHAPIKRVTVSNCSKPKPQPWVTSDLKHLLQKRRHLHRKFLKNPSNQRLHQQYRAVRREGTLLNRRLKAEYMMKQFKSMKRNPRGPVGPNKLTLRAFQTSFLP